MRNTTARMDASHPVNTYTQVSGTHRDKVRPLSHHRRAKCPIGVVHRWYIAGLTERVANGSARSPNDYGLGAPEPGLDEGKTQTASSAGLDDQQ